MLLVSISLFVPLTNVPAAFTEYTQNQKIVNIDETASIIVTGSLSCDLKVRKSGDTGWLDSITAQVGNTLEFKIEISSTEGKIAVAIQFPYVDDNVMLNYVRGSASETPFLAVNEAIIWLFVEIPPSEITFKAKIKKTGTGSVNLIVCSTEDPELEDEDSVQVTGKEKGPINKQLISLEAGIYVENVKKISFPITIVVGSIDIMVDAEGASRVEFYLDDELKATDDASPYSWTWDEFSFGSHTLKVIAYDNAGNSDTDEMTVWKFF